MLRRSRDAADMDVSRPASTLAAIFGGVFSQSVASIFLGSTSCHQVSETPTRMLHL